MLAVYLILFVIAAVCFGAAAFGSSNRVVSPRLVPLGLFSWVLVYVIQSLVKLV